jgi:hypothetical protein
MGKRRLKERVREAGEAFEAARDAAVEEQLEAARPDEELFFVDTEARCVRVRSRRWCRWMCGSGGQTGVCVGIVVRSAP